jgi:recombinational DNA repair ATPase RecF
MDPLLRSELVVRMRKLEQKRARGKLHLRVPIRTSIRSRARAIDQALIEEPPNGFKHDQSSDTSAAGPTTVDQGRTRQRFTSP